MAETIVERCRRRVDEARKRLDVAEADLKAALAKSTRALLAAGFLPISAIDGGFGTPTGDPYRDEVLTRIAAEDDVDG